jgi:hypothetical protein
MASRVALIVQHCVQARVTLYFILGAQLIPLVSAGRRWSTNMATIVQVRLQVTLATRTRALRTLVPAAIRSRILPPQITQNQIVVRHLYVL